MKYLSLFSGIDAASVAWLPLGWECVGLAEIEPFPNAVLSYHYPNIRNFGNVMGDTFIQDVASTLPDIVIGGSPCQSFSVAGLRQSLNDSRGELSLRYIQIIEALDAARISNGLEPVIVVYENVPGMLNTNDNAFGCFLGALSGEDDALEPPGGKWSNAGAVFGPQRTIAWVVKDAQYFGVAQRRRRVFLVASARKDFDPTTVLFESEGVRRDIAPRRESVQSVTYPVAPCLTSSGRGVERIGETRGQDPVVAVQTFDRQSSGEYGSAAIVDAMAARDYKSASDLIAYGIPGNWIGREPKNGGNAVAPMVDIAPCQTKTDVHGVAFTPFEVAGTMKSCNQSGGFSNSIDHAAGGYMALQGEMQVRKLTPVECERLQGFPDTYTAIPWRGKSAEDCPDGPRYKALGNSMAVPCITWIGQRILDHRARVSHNDDLDRSIT